MQTAALLLEYCLSDIDASTADESDLAQLSGLPLLPLQVRMPPAIDRVCELCCLWPWRADGLRARGDVGPRFHGVGVCIRF